MSTAIQAQPAAPPLVVARPPAWRWVHVAVAALAMVATLPGRTHGLGLITEPLLRDLNLGRVTYGSINLWATLLGAAFCLPCGWLIDRFGVRVVLTAIFAALSGVVLLMTSLPHNSGPDAAGMFVVAELFAFLLLTRGLGQAALSVVSLALVGKAAGRRSGLAIGVYSFLVAAGFMAANGAAKYFLVGWQSAAIRQAAAGTVGLLAVPAGQSPFMAASAYAAGKDAIDWRPLWAGIGIGLFLCAIVAALAVRPRVCGWGGDSGGAVLRAGPSAGSTLAQALATPAFWVFSLAISFYGLIAAGTSLFGQSILQERGFELRVFLTILTISPMIGLASNLATGWLAARWSMNRLLAIAMVLLAGALAAFPLVQTLWQVYAYAVVIGVAGGMITVLFFAVWGSAYGPAHLGKIQGAAQMLTVLASALGSLLPALSKDYAGSYTLLFQIAAGVAALFAVVAWLTHLPEGAHA